MTVGVVTKIGGLFLAIPERSLHMLLKLTNVDSFEARHAKHINKHMSGMYRLELLIQTLENSNDTVRISEPRQ